MRRVISTIVCILMAGFYADLQAQIPERVLFQPGSYAVPHRSFPRTEPVNPAVAQAQTDTEEADDSSKTDWEKKFSPQIIESTPATPPVTYEVPHLTYVYNHWTGRFHVVPYEPGYAASPSAFPVQTSPLHIWISSKSSASQPNPQVQYMSYYDPDPVILPAEIQLSGSRFSAPFTQLQPMPLPVPKPATAQSISPPARTRLGERVRRNLDLGPFIVP